MSNTQALAVIAVAGACLYALWLVFRFTFSMIEIYHAAWREERYRAAEPRTHGVEQGGEQEA